MVKNYLVCAVRPITDGWHMENNQDLYKAYREMYDHSVASFKKFVEEPFESILWEEPVKNNDEYTIANWNAIWNLWSQEPCNIFWAGADTIMVQPTSLFSDRFKEYRLFNYTDPKQYRGFVNYFNDDIQYYPHTMSERTWQVGQHLWSIKQGHPDEFWGFDQLRHNEMFWSQGISEGDWFHPKLAYQCHRMRDFNPEAVEFHNEWNNCHLTDAHILHFHASRGSQQVINIMKAISQQLGIIDGTNS